MDLGGGLRLDLRMSGIWQLESAVLSSNDVCVVVDPAYFPRELAELRALVDERGRAEHVVFTHGHWDHVMGWRTFPEAGVLASPKLVEAASSSSEAAKKNLSDAFDFDGQWYVPRTGPYEWPAKIEPVTEGDTILLGHVRIEALHLPGHSDDGLALIAREYGLLLAGDYLSPCEIPFVEALSEYRATLHRLLKELDQLERIVPGHGPMLTRWEAQAIARRDLDYLDAIGSAVERNARDEALAIPLPRSAGVPGMGDHHLVNLRKSGFDV
jgi:glyoxylase-like metal-dependent hydrolase (beta-lactamase superfamily II)